MKPKISVLLATNRINDKIFKYIHKLIPNLDKIEDNLFTTEFKSLIKNRLDGCDHFLYPTLLSLSEQSFDDFELVISHRYPKDAIEVCKGWDFPIKLIKEKHSIWHDLGEQYHTVANNKNTAFINSKGELIYHIDDLTFFNENLLQEAWDLYKQDIYMTGRTVRCITYDKNLYKDKRDYKIGPGKQVIQSNGWIGQVKALSDICNHPEIPMSSFWTCSASVSAIELLEINGYDELYDGSLAGIDMDAGIRLSRISRYKRVASNTFLYEIDDPTPKNMIRDDVKMRELLRISHTKGNSWKPTMGQINRYKYWHNNTIGELDNNWNKFMNIPLYTLRRNEDIICDC